MFHRSIAMSLFTACLLAAASGGAYAQIGGPFDLGWNTIDCGGATFSTGGAFSVGGTIGQPDASPEMIGGPFAVTGGFWVRFVPPCDQSCLGDLNSDRRVNQSDLGILLAAWQRTTDGDINCDGATNQSDLGILLANWGRICP